MKDMIILSIAIPIFLVGLASISGNRWSEQSEQENSAR